MMAWKKIAALQTISIKCEMCGSRRKVILNWYHHLFFKTIWFGSDIEGSFRERRREREREREQGDNISKLKKNVFCRIKIRAKS